MTTIQAQNEDATTSARQRTYYHPSPKNPCIRHVKEQQQQQQQQQGLQESMIMMTLLESQQTTATTIIAMVIIKMRLLPNYYPLKQQQLNTTEYYPSTSSCWTKISQLSRTTRWSTCRNHPQEEKQDDDDDDSPSKQGRMANSSKNLDSFATMSSSWQQQHFDYELGVGASSVLFVECLVDAVHDILGVGSSPSPLLEAIDYYDDDTDNNNTASETILHSVFCKWDDELYQKLKFAQDPLPTSPKEYTFTITIISKWIPYWFVQQ
jgi:hypothetical protein